MSQEEIKERVETFFESSVIVEDGATTIVNRKYLNCPSLVEVVIPDSVKSVEEWAFYGCRNLNRVYYKGTASDWDKIEIAANNRELQKAFVLFYMESKPGERGKYWHYDEEGNPKEW